MKLRLDKLAQHVDVEPGGEIVLRGSYTSSFDGSTIDAAATYWPEDAPGGASVDSGGLVDFAAGGFHLKSRDPDTHEVVAVATGKDAPACDAAGVAAPCIALRVLPQARSRLITMNEWSQSLNGEISLEVEEVAVAEVVEPPAYEPAVDALSTPWVQGALAVGAALALGAIALTVMKKRRQTPRGQLMELARRVRAKLDGADAALAAPLSPAVESALGVLRRGRVDATSKEGKRVAAVLQRVEARIEATNEAERANREQEAADELVHEMEAALEAADETLQVAEVRPRERS